MLERKMITLVNILLDKSNISIQDLEISSGLTRRQIEYNIDKINEVFLSNSIDLIKIEDGRVSISHSNRNDIIHILLKSIEHEQYIMDGKERVRFLFLILFVFHRDYLSLNHLMEAMQVGRTTIQSDLRQLETELSQYGITIHYTRKDGYHLKGNEFDIRYALMKQIIDELANETGNIVYIQFIKFYNLRSIEETTEIILSELKLFNLSIIEKRIEELAYILNFMSYRLDISLNEFYQEYNLPMIEKLLEYEFTKNILDKFNINKKDAILYVTAWVLGQTIGNSEKKTPDYSIIHELTNRIVLRFEAISGVKFSDIQTVVHQLYTHLRPTYYRLFFRLPIINPLTDQIKKEYNGLFNIVEETLKPIEGLFDHSIPDDEVAFLTLHFLSLINSNSEASIKQKKAVVVCPNGIGSSAIVLNELKILFPEIKFYGPIEMNKIMERENEFDIIFSTVNNVRLFMIDKPVFVVHPILTTAEKYRLIREVYKEIGNNAFRLPSVERLMNIINKHVKSDNDAQLRSDLYRYLTNAESRESNFDQQSIQLSEIMTKNLIQLDVAPKNWEEAIRISAKPFLEGGYVNNNYVNEIISIFKQTGPYMVITKHVALPHAKPSDGVYRMGIGLTTLNQPIVFGKTENNPVKYIFFLASYDNTSHIEALSQLLKCLEDEHFYQLLENAKKPEEIQLFIKNVENRLLYDGSLN